MVSHNDIEEGQPIQKSMSDVEGQQHIQQSDASGEQQIKGILRSSRFSQRQQSFDSTAERSSRSSTPSRRQGSFDSTNNVERSTKKSIRRQSTFDSTTTDDPSSSRLGKSERHGSVYERHSIFEDGEDKESIHLVSKWIIGLAQILTLIIIVATTVHQVRSHKKNDSPSSADNNNVTSLPPVVESVINETEGLGSIITNATSDVHFVFGEEEEVDETPLVEAKEMAEEGDDNVQTPIIYEEVKDLLEEGESLVQDINNAETKEQKEALQEEFEVLAELEDTEIQEWSDLEDAGADAAETNNKDAMEHELQAILEEEEDNLHHQADVLDQEAHAETEEEIEALKEQLEVLKVQIEELQQVQMDIQNKNGGHAQGDGGDDGS